MPPSLVLTYSPPRTPRGHIQKDTTRAKDFDLQFESNEDWYYRQPKPTLNLSLDNIWDRLNLRQGEKSKITLRPDTVGMGEKYPQSVRLGLAHEIHCMQIWHEQTVSEKSWEKQVIFWQAFSSTIQAHEYCMYQQEEVQNNVQESCRVVLTPEVHRQFPGPVLWEYKGRETTE